MLAQQGEWRQGLARRAMCHQAYAGLRHQLGAGAGLGFGHLTEAEAVAHRHAPIHSQGPRALADLADGEQTEIAGFMQMNIDTHTAPIGDGEDAVELSGRVRIDLARVDTADQIGARGHGGIEQIQNARATHHAALRKRDDLDAGPRAVVLPRLQDPFQGMQFALRRNVHMGAQCAGAMCGGGADQMRGTVRGAERQPRHGLAFLLDAAHDRRPGLVRCPRHAEQRLVEVHVPIDQQRHDELTLQIQRRIAGVGDLGHGRDFVDQRIADRQTYQATIGEQGVVDMAHAGGGRLRA